jgi:hypothetical protein
VIIYFFDTLDCDTRTHAFPNNILPAKLLDKRFSVRKALTIDSVDIAQQSSISRKERPIAGLQDFI